MAKYFAQRLFGGTNPARPAIGPLTALQLMRKDRVVPVFASQDTILGAGRRILARFGMLGANRFLPDWGANPVNASQVYPSPTDARYVDRLKVEVTPGCYLAARVACIPSSETQIPDGGSWKSGGAGGRIVVQAEYAGATTSRREAFIEPSTRQYAEEPDQTDAAIAWPTVIVRDIVAIRPDDSLSDVTVAEATSNYNTVTVEIFYIGGIRCIDGVLYEVPEVLAMEADDIDWPAHILAPISVGGGIPAWPVFQYPLQRASETTPDGDPRLGTWHSMDVINRQAAVLGPCLVGWSSHGDHTAAVTDIEPDPFTTTSATFVNLMDSTLTAYSTSYQGWSLSSGGYARRHALADETVVLPTDGVVPVRIRCYGKITAGQTGTLRFQSSAYSWADVSITNSSYGTWSESIGWLQCGQNPEDVSNMQVLWKTTGGTLELKHFRVYYGDVKLS